MVLGAKLHLFWPQWETEECKQYKGSVKGLSHLCRVDKGLSNG